LTSSGEKFDWIRVALAAFEIPARRATSRGVPNTLNFWRQGASAAALPKPSLDGSPRSWLSYYKWSSKRPPRDLLLQALNHIEWEGGRSRGRRAIDIGFGSGTDTLELLRRGWRVLAIDGQEVAAQFLAGRVPAQWRPRLTTLVAPMEGLELPRADLVYASFSLPFCSPERFPKLWSTIRGAVLPRGHFAGQLFGDQDEWRGERPMAFHSRGQLSRLCRGWKVEMVRETTEEGRSFRDPKHWHFFDLILERPRGTLERRH
jgi:tellurite methyltransferase